MEDLDLVIRCNRMLDWQIQHDRRYDLYYEGRQPLALLPESVRRDCGDRLPEVRIGFARLIIDALEERIDLAGFKVNDDRTSSELWEIFQRSDGDEVSQMAHLEALIHGRAYVMVWAGRDGYPKISCESSRHAIVFQMPGVSHRIAGLKRWIDADGYAYCTLFTPTTVTRWRSPNKISLDPYLNPATVGNPGYPFDSYTFYDWSQLPASGWELRAEPMVNPLGCVPMIPLVNRPRLLNPIGKSELDAAIPIIDAIDLLTTDLLITAEYSAMPRRWATGIEVRTKVNPDTGQEEVIDPFSRMKGKVWQAESPDTAFGQFPEASLTNYGEAILNLTQSLGAIAGLPAHYLGISREPASADAIRSSEAPLVRKAQRKCRQFGGAWEEVMRIADVILHGQRRKPLELMEAVWSDAETRTVAQSADAAGKLAQIGIPLPQIAEDLGYSPQEIQQIPAKEVLAGAPTNGAGPPDAPETQREIRRDNDAAR